MKLPDPENAIIDSGKLRDYLLSSEHPIGRFKATFFAALGYSREGSFRLEGDLRALIASEPAILGGASPFGQKYDVRWYAYWTRRTVGASGDRVDRFGGRNFTKVCHGLSGVIAMRFKRARYLRYVAVAVVSALVGLVIGVLVGGNLIARVFDNVVAQPLMTAGGDQAHKTLVLLEEGDGETLRWYLESEIDDALGTLQELEQIDGLQRDSSAWQLYERLRNYRESHPPPPPRGQPH